LKDAAGLDGTDLAVEIKPPKIGKFHEKFGVFL